MTQKNSTLALDKLTRNRIFNSRYWKQQCFALDASTFLDKAIKIKTIGGLYGGAKKPTKFLCLVYKMLQMNISKQIALQYLKARQYKYLTAITLFYLRLTRKGVEVYQLLEPFYNDNRKLILKDNIGRHQITYIDQYVDKLLHDQVVLGIALPFLQKRMTLQQLEQIQPRVSILEQEDIQMDQENNQQNQEQQQYPEKIQEENQQEQSEN